MGQEQEGQGQEQEQGQKAPRTDAKSRRIAELEAKIRELQYENTELRVLTGRAHGLLFAAAFDRTGFNRHPRLETERLLDLLEHATLGGRLP